jgi:hypothetical protein
VEKACPRSSDGIDHAIGEDGIACQRLQYKDKADCQACIKNTNQGESLDFPELLDGETRTSATTDDMHLSR